MCKRRLGLRVQMPVAVPNLHQGPPVLVSPLPQSFKDRLITYRLRVQLSALNPVVNSPRLRPRDVNYPVHKDMGHVHALRTELPRERLAQCAQRKLACRESTEVGGPLHRRGSACQDERRRVGGLLDGLEERREDLLRKEEKAASKSIWC